MNKKPHRPTQPNDSQTNGNHYANNDYSKQDKEAKYFGTPYEKNDQAPYKSVHSTSQAHKMDPNKYKINPIKIPRPGQLWEIHSNTLDNTPVYTTNIDSLPPYASTYYIVKETDNSSCRFIRSTLTKIPTTQAILSESSLIFSLYFQPFAEVADNEAEVPKVEINDRIFRCIKCQSYINLHYQITYGKTTNGKVAICNICSAESPMDASLQQGCKEAYLSTDYSSEPEMTRATIDYAIHQQHQSVNEVEAFMPHYIFMIDMSIGSHAMGLPGYVLNSIMNNLSLFHNAKDTYIAICIYNEKGINFFYCKHNEVKCCNMTDINNPFCPIPQGRLFSNVTSNRSSIEKMIEKIGGYIEEYHSKVSNCGSYKDNTAATGAAIFVGIEALLGNGGRVMAFTSSSCQVGFGKTNPKNDNEYYNTDSESILYQPQHRDFDDIISKAIGSKVTVDQFIISSREYDLGTYSVISNMTCGHVKYYPIGKDTMELNWSYEKLYYDFTRIITRPNYYDVKLMIRYTEGIDCFEILGAFNKKLGEAFHIPSCDPDYSFAYNFRIKEDLKPNQRISFQIACLYNDNFNQKFLRVFNYAIIATNDISRIYLSSDVDALAKIILMKEVSLAIQFNPETARQNLYTRLLNSFAYYRKEGSLEKDPTQLILPSSMKFLPLFLNSFLKKNLLGNTKAYVSSNSLMALINNILRDPLYSTTKMLYPKFYRIDDIQYDQAYKFKDKTQVIENVGMVDQRLGRIQLPYKMPLSLDYIDFDSAYIIDDGEYINFFVFDRINGEFYKEVFGEETWGDCVEKGVAGISEGDGNGSDDGDLKRRALNIIGEMRNRNGGVYQGVRMYFLSERNYHNLNLTKLLIEDRLYNEMNYVDFLCRLHEDIQRKMC